jgi:site-specific DNA-methyltransferase (adenine-specific)
MTINKALYSSKKEDWRTPRDVLDVVREVAQISLDPCADKDEKNWFACENWTHVESQCPEYGSGSKFIMAFVNPPYGRKTEEWVYIINSLALDHVDEIISLLPARTDTQWFKMAWRSSRAYCFWEGRIKFVGAPHPAPFPSVLFYAGPNPHRFCDVFQRKGIVGLI